MTIRISRDAYGLKLAEAAALRADCTRRQVGAVIVAPDGSIVATGYNGLSAGKPGCLTAGACPRGQMSYPSEPPYAEGDPDPTPYGKDVFSLRGNAVVRCGADDTDDGGYYVCTLEAEHDGGWHIAGDGVAVWRIWPIASTQPASVDYEATGCRAVHAEVNAIIRAGRDRCVGATIYVTDEPCFHCSVVIEGAGLARVVTPAECEDLHETYSDDGTTYVPRDHWGRGCPGPTIREQLHEASARARALPPHARPTVTHPRED